MENKMDKEQFIKAVHAIVKEKNISEDIVSSSQLDIHYANKLAYNFVNVADIVGL